MHFQDILRAAQSTCLLLWVVWMFAYGFVDTRHNTAFRLLRRYFFEMRPFIPAIAITEFLCGAIRFGTEDVGVRIIVLIFALGHWWLARHEDDDDDRWQKRLDAVKTRVAVVRNRLRIVPAT